MKNKFETKDAIFTYYKGINDCFGIDEPVFGKRDIVDYLFWNNFTHKTDRYRWDNEFWNEV